MTKYNGYIVNWSQVRMVENDDGTFIDPRDRSKVFAAVKHFMNCAQLPEVKAAIQHFGTSASFPTSVLSIIDKYHLTDDFDNSWQVLFDVKDFRNSKRDGFKILNVGHGLTFSETPIGGQAKVYPIAGAEVTVKFAKYSGGLDWPTELFEDEEFWTIEDNAKAFRNAYFHDKAAVAYALIDALPSGQNQAWAAVTGSIATTDANYTAIRDMNTINAAILEILTDLKDKSYGVGVKTVFQILAPLTLMPRIQRALGLLNAGISAGLVGIPYTIRATYTLSLSSNTVYYVGIKGIKNIWGERRDLDIKDRFDIMSDSTTAVGWARFGGALGDTEQIQRCSIS